MDKELDWSFAGWSRRFWLGAAIWLAILVVVVAFADSRAAAWVGRNIPVPRLMWIFKIMKAPGHFLFTLLIAATLVLWHPESRILIGGVMRVLILSDVHANPWALRAVEADAGVVDRTLFAGDAVNYGPSPGACVEWLDKHEVVGVRGNHDHAVAFAVDPKASPAKEPLALAMRDWTRDHLDPVQAGWLLKLPRKLDCHVGGTKFVLVHGTPVDPLYDYRLQPEISKQLLDELVGGIKADVLVVGHTHLPVHRSHGSLQIVNPGSVGQPLDGDPRAAYAIWEDGKIELKRVEYDRSALFDALRRLPLSQQHVDDLIYTLEHGRMTQTMVEGRIQ